MIEEVRCLELELECSLQVIWVPGLAMINQGTDGLSRGVWMSPYHNLRDSRVLTHHVFDPMTFDPSIVDAYITAFRLPLAWHHRPWRQTWDARTCFNRLTVWFPPPELARQLLSFLLETWVERPLTTSALIFVPRVVAAFWFGLSRHLIELPTIYPHVQPLRFAPVLPIPVVVLYLPPFVRSFSPPHRMGRPTLPSDHQWHRQQAAQMRGLPICSLS